MARGRAFADDGSAAALAYALGSAADGAVVVKADGLAAGKGVTVCDTARRGRRARSPRSSRHRSSSRSGSTGREASVIAICDGRRAVALPIARDHKRLADGDAGPNTGGMGAVLAAAGPARRRGRRRSSSGSTGRSSPSSPGAARRSAAPSTPA